MNLLVICLLVLNLKLIFAYDIDNLLKRMTIEDKCGQMTQIDVALIRNYMPQNDDDFVDLEKLRLALKVYKVGSILGITTLRPKAWHSIIKTIQDVALNETAHGIPIIYGIDSIHGAFVENSVVFPQPLSWAATFNKELIGKIGEVIAKETRAQGIPWNFSPVLDIGRQPLWPRY